MEPIQCTREATVTIMLNRIAIIGAGPCGLSMLRAFAAAKSAGTQLPEIVCFEKQDDWGGLWNYTWRTGTGAYGEPVHGSMYRYLWSNGPKECLEFADYSFEEHFGRAIPSFPPRGVLADYILGRAENSGMRPQVRFSTEVRQARFDAGTDEFVVETEELASGNRQTDHFDGLVVASGHFSVPHVPDFDGIADFTGRTLHAHDFRDAAQFAGQDVLIVGASYSAEDIGLQCHKYGARSVTMTYRTAAMGFNWPEGVDERPLLQRIDGPTVHFKDGSAKDFDAIILCTGYLHHFPFLADDLRLRTRNRLYPPDLYKGVFFIPNPRVMYLGMQDQYYTFTMFDAQAWYARDVILGRIALPGADEMSRDAAAWVQREEALTNPHEDIDFQADYMRDLLREVDYPAFDIDYTVAAFNEWEHHKEEDILTYRNQAFRSPCTGTMSPVHHTPWIKAMDDSVATYIGAAG